MTTTPKKKSSLTSDDNIISKDPNAALGLAKSISRTEAEEIEAARLVHETHERIVTEKSTGTRKQTCVVFKDNVTVSKKKTTGPILKTQSEGVGVLPENSDEQSIKEGDVPWIYSDDDEDNDNDDDQSINIEETDDDELTESDNEDQEMDDAEKNDEDKVEEEKDIDQELALYEQ
nr:hypothetical protein [Tanacetum cinerariifolium]